MKKPYMRKPTHHLVADGVIYADIRCGAFKPTVRLRSTGETVRSASAIMDCDLLMGRWCGPVWYLFGPESDHIPRKAQMVKAGGGVT